MTMLATDLFSQSAKPSFVLVHGGWHAAWSWNKVVPLLQNKGYTVVAPDLPGHGSDSAPTATVTLEDYVNRVVEVARQQNGPVILVGHSSGGTVIAQAAELLGTQKVASLIFLDAFMPLNGESVISLVQKYPSNSEGTSGAALAESQIFSSDQKTSTLNLDKVQELLYHDCPANDVAFAKSRLGPQPLATIVTPVTVTDQRYGIIPKYYILCTEAKDFDKTRIASNVPTKQIYRLKSSHSPFFSMPVQLVTILDEVYQKSAEPVSNR